MGVWLDHGGLRRAVGMARAVRSHAPHMATIPPTAVDRGVNGLGEGLTCILVLAKPRQHVVIRPRRGSGPRGAAHPRAPADG